MNVFFSHVQSEMRQMRWTSVIRRLDEIYDRLQQSMFLLVEGCCWNIHVIFVSNILMKEDLLCTRMFVSSPCNCMFVWNHLSVEVKRVWLEQRVTCWKVQEQKDLVIWACYILIDWSFLCCFYFTFVIWSHILLSLSPHINVFFNT